MVAWCGEGVFGTLVLVVFPFPNVMLDTVFVCLLPFKTRKFFRIQNETQQDLSERDQRSSAQEPPPLLGHDLLPDQE